MMWRNERKSESLKCQIELVNVKHVPDMDVDLRRVRDN
jgi:hypothetical protein